MPNVEVLSYVCYIVKLKVIVEGAAVKQSRYDGQYEWGDIVVYPRSRGFLFRLIFHRVSFLNRVLFNVRLSL